LTWAESRIPPRQKKANLAAEDVFGEGTRLASEAGRRCRQPVLI